MDIIETLKGFGNDLLMDGTKPVASVIFANNYEQNIKSQDTLYPTLQILPILNSGLEIGKFGQMHNVWQMFIYFGDVQPDGVDSGSEENDPIVMRMRSVAITYIGNLLKSGLFELISKVDFQTQCFKSDALISGVLAIFTLKEKEGFRIC